MTVYVNNEPYEITPTSRIEMTGAEYIKDQSDRDKLLENLEDAYEMNQEIPKLEKQIEDLQWQLKKEKCLVSALLERDNSFKDMTQRLKTAEAATATINRQYMTCIEVTGSLKAENKQLQKELDEAHNRLKKVDTYA